jgi:hypothetical protein
MDESTHDIPVGLGPTWMNKASSILLQIIQSPSNIVRRAAAEGLAFVATLGVKEDMHFLQSSVLHSLDELITGASNQGQGRNILHDDTQAGRSGGLLTLACMQRNTYQIKERRVARSRLRGSPRGPKDDGEDSLPVIQIMIRLLPYISGRQSGATSLAARTSALHSLLLLLEYSEIFKDRSLNPEDSHLLKKAVEIVEDNFLSAWTIASQIIDQGNESAKVVFEVSFVAVLLRLMTFLTPFLHHLRGIDSSVAKRLSTMGAIIAESLGQHPVVQCEAMAFFEVLASHQELLPPHCGGTKYDEHPILCSIPFMMVNITPYQTSVLSPGIWTAPRGCQSSTFALRTTLKAIRVLGLSHISVAEWSDMKATALLFASLEKAVSSSTYPEDAVFRGLAAPREAGMCGSAEAVYEIPDVLRFLLYLERRSGTLSESVLLRFILLARAMISGVSNAKGSTDDEDGGVSALAMVTKTALERARLDSHSVFDVAKSVRWQVKATAVQLANIALMELAERCRQTTGPDLLKSPSFNPVLAAKEIAQAFEDGDNIEVVTPKSFLSLHINDILMASCIGSTATVDQVELRILQENAMYFLANVIKVIGAIPDPNEPGTTILSEYVPQVSSCIKNALAAKDEQLNDMTSRLFWAGCQALRYFIDKRVTEDKGVLKRIIRPTLMSKNEAPFFHFAKINEDDSDTVEEDANVNIRSSMLVKVGKIWTLGNIPLKDRDVATMLEADLHGLGVQAAAVSVDGANLLLSNNLSLVGEPAEEAHAKGDSFYFFSFRDVTEIDDYVKGALVETWASNLLSAVGLLSEVVLSKDSTPEICEACTQWLKLLVPIAFLGLSDSINAITSVTRDRTPWATSVSIVEVFSACLEAISVISDSSNLVAIDGTWRKRIESLVIGVCRRILIPVLRAPTSRSITMNADMPELVDKSCSLLRSLAVALTTSTKSSETPRFALTILCPLELLQEGELDLSNFMVATIISACLAAMAEIVENGQASPSLVNALLSLILSLSVREMMIPQSVRAASHQLLKQCVLHESVKLSEQCVMAVTLAKNRDWGSWSVVVGANDGVAAESSFVEVEKALLNPSYVGEQLTALAAVRGLIQISPPTGALVGRIITALGAEILSIFQAYGLHAPTEVRSERPTACADCMKIILAAYQQITADFTEDEVSQFLEVVFATFIVTIRFNGLPNHPPPKGNLSDASIGKMCAQAITHVARTTPGPFKECMNKMSENDRVVLEFAVRADVSGYTVAEAAASAKKKLSLKGFKT